MFIVIEDDLISKCMCNLNVWTIINLMSWTDFQQAILIKLEKNVNLWHTLHIWFRVIELHFKIFGFQTKCSVSSLSRSCTNLLWLRKICANKLSWKWEQNVWPRVLAICMNTTFHYLCCSNEVLLSMFEHSWLPCLNLFRWLCIYLNCRNVLAHRIFFNCIPNITARACFWTNFASLFGKSLRLLNFLAFSRSVEAFTQKYLHQNTFTSQPIFTGILSIFGFSVNTTKKRQRESCLI